MWHPLVCTRRIDSQVETAIRFMGTIFSEEPQVGLSDIANRHNDTGAPDQVPLLRSSKIARKNHRKPNVQQIQDAAMKDTWAVFSLMFLF